MTPDERKALLLKYFASEEYIRSFLQDYEEFWQNLKAAIQYFEGHPPDDYDAWPSKERTEIWHDRVLSRHRSKIDFEKFFQEYLNNESSTLGTKIYNHGRLISNIFNWMVLKWLDYLPDDIRATVFSPYDSKQASNIYRTIENRWRPGSILKETVTGPIDEEALLRFRDKLS